MANDQAKPKPLLTAIGARLRTLRETAGRRQEDVAFAARRWGFPWTRIAVAQIELGRRRVSVEEWLLLPAILQEALGCSVTWADLMPTEERCALNRETWAWPPFLSHLVDRQGQVAVEDEELIERPVTRQIRALNAMEVLGRRLWPHGAPLETIQAAASAAQGEAERKAAYTLRATPQAVALAAIRAWGRSLTAERDARLADRRPAVGRDEVDRAPDRGRLSAVRDRKRCGPAGRRQAAGGHILGHTSRLHGGMVSCKVAKFRYGLVVQPG